MLKETLLYGKTNNLLKNKRVVIVEHGSKISKHIVEQWDDSENVGLSLGDSQKSNLQRLELEEIDALDQIKPEIVLLVSDTPSPDFEKKVLEKCRHLSIPVLPILGKGSLVLIGPLETPGRPGCVTCLQLRWEHSMLRAKVRATVKQHHYEVNQFVVQFGLSQSELKLLAKNIRSELYSLFHNTAIKNNIKGKVGIYRREAGVEWVPLLPSHNCPRCNLRPIDDSKLGELEFESHYIKDMSSLRVKSVDHDDLNELYVHRNVGYISSINEYGTEGKYIRASAFVQTPYGSHVGHGSGFSTNEARQKAILEVVERLCSVRATNRRPVVFASYNEICDTAVDPTLFGLHEDEFFQTSSSYFEPYSHNKKYSWIWAYSTKTGQPILIPEQIAYYGATRDVKRFVKDSSSGCALGGSLEEASLFGIFEVLERDGFLNMWYGKLHVPELKLGDDCPHDVFQAYSMVKNSGYDVRLFNLSHDMRIPAILAVAVRSGKGGPRVICGTSCHLNPYEAAKGALRELFVQVLHIEGISEKRRQEGYDMLKDPKRIKEILDHVVVASLPEAYPRWEFLLKRTDDQTIHTIEDVFDCSHSRYQMESGDIRLILEAVLEDLHQKGFDVIIVNQTNAEATSGGLFAAKALIPGMTPITFGYGGHRVRGLKRVFELPYRLGYTANVLTPDELNKYCHPLS